MSYSTPRTWVAGEYPTAAEFNQEIRDNISFLANPPGCRVYHNTTQSVSDNTITVVSFNSERFDTDTMHDTSSNNSRLTIKTAGLYLVTFTGVFAQGSDYARVYADIQLNGATAIAIDDKATPAIAHSPGVRVSTVYKLAVNDYLQARVYHDNTANTARNLLNTGNYSPEFAAVRIGAG
ncbi:MAG TPA: hypothetical protein VHL53_13100 [Acidimicrobiia bacterium]|nr:hypothetical protein [Acidimicrobiia bacterium]